MRATQVGESDWIRLDWSRADGVPNPPDHFEIRRKDIQEGVDPSETVIGVASGRPDVRVFVDKTPKNANAQYIYRLFPKAGAGLDGCPSVGIRLKAGTPTRVVRRHLDFDDGRLANALDDQYVHMVRPANTAIEYAWTLKDGRLDWLDTVPKAAYETSRLVIGPETDGTQITARLAIMGDLPPADCDGPGVGVGIIDHDGGRQLSLVLRGSGSSADKAVIQFLHESLADGDAGPAGTLLPNPQGTAGLEFDLPGRERSDPGKLTWIWLKVALENGELLGKAWRDDAKEPDRWLIRSKNFKNEGWSGARAVLIGGSGETRASFGEVFIEGLRVSTTTLRDGREGPGERARATSSSDGTTSPVETVARSEPPEKNPRLERLAAVPFEGLPTVIRLVPRASMRPDERDQVEDGPPRLGSDEDPALHFDFAAPAHFPLPRFGDCDEYLDDEGVLIYEGMRLDVASDGRYEVRFIATTPAMPVTLRLQLSLARHDGSERTVTIPPIEVPPYTNGRGEYEPATWKIRHQGYSYNLATRPSPQVRDSDFPDLPAPGRENLRIAGFHSVRREGAARFGSYPPPSR
ncbi:hypothetical protein [Paludisphaera sp.]|uniref:hypothetical protein n=1 Tax=Paludisphaera sp. TaxID=2017432 RepID=UPI00301BE041